MFIAYVALLALTTLGSSAYGQIGSEHSLFPERRREQTRTEPGYVASPVAVNIPGVGFSYGVVGSIFNIAETEMDTFFFTASGDSNGIGLGSLDTPLLGKWLTFNVFLNKFRGTGLETHRRGIYSNPEDRTIIKLNETQLVLGQITARFWAKRLQLNLGIIENKGSVDSILDKDGNVLGKPSAEVSTRLSTSLGASIDLTDDKSDPRDGAQFEFQYFAPSEGEAGDPKYHIIDYNALYYIPVLESSTWVFNLFRSDAVVTKKGETDVNVIRASESLNCDSPLIPDAAKTACQEKENQAIEEKLAFNKRGSASSLGGTLRMRSFVTGRYSSAYASMLGTEFRWNLTDEFTPFDILVAAGIRTGLQIAFFGEWGTVQEYSSRLTQDIRHSYGVGFRAVIASGFIFRLDLANGSEGFQPVLFFNYPWFVF